MKNHITLALSAVLMTATASYAQLPEVNPSPLTDTQLQADIANRNANAGVGAIGQTVTNQSRKAETYQREARRQLGGNASFADEVEVTRQLNMQSRNGASIR